MGTKYTVDNNGIVTLTNNLIVDINDLYIDTVAHRAGFGTATPAYRVDVLGDVNISGVFRVAGSQLSSANLSDGGSLTASALKDATGIVSVSAATAPTLDQVLTATDPTHATWQTSTAYALKDATGIVTVSAATAPTLGQVLTATDATHANWQTPTGGGGGTPGGVNTDVQFNSSGSFGGDANFTWDNTVNKRLAVANEVVGYIATGTETPGSGLDRIRLNNGDKVQWTAGGSLTSSASNFKIDATTGANSLLVNSTVNAGTAGFAVYSGGATPGQVFLIDPAGVNSYIGTNFGINIFPAAYTLDVQGDSHSNGFSKATRFIETYSNTGNVTTTTTVDWSTGAVQRITLTSANCTISFSNTLVGQTMTLMITQDSVGGRTVTWPTIAWPGSATPTLTTTAFKTDIFSIFYDGTGQGANPASGLWGFTGGQNY